MGKAASEAEKTAVALVMSWRVDLSSELNVPEEADEAEADETVKWR